MRPSIGLAVLAAVVLTLVPAAQAATTVDFTFSTFVNATIHVSATSTGEESAQARAYMDQNQDGQVTQAEVDQFVNSFKDLFAGSLKSDLKSNTTLDGKEPTAVTINSLQITGATGPTSSTQEMTAIFDLGVTFVPDAGDAHTLKLIGSSQQGSETAQVTIRAPSGSIITSTSGLPSSTLASDKSSVSYTDSSSNSQTGTIVFGKASAAAGGASSPGAGLAAIVVCLAGAALLRRRA